MTVSPARKSLRRLAAALLVAGLAAVGCGQKPSPPAAAAGDGPTASVATAPAPAAKPAAAEPAGKPAPPATRDRLHQSFADATRAADNPPADANRPPDETVTKKPVFKILEAVVARWDTIRFVSPAGKKISYDADVETSEGRMRIALFGEIAPNHVRSFIALARAGYYDELFFDRVRHERGEGAELQAVEAGCPLGTGEPGNGSIGYWLKDEFNPAEKVSHEEGSVGACHGVDADTAACRFYITLNKASFLDGNFTVFGKVVEGLDVARKIYLQPVIVDDQDRDGARRPEKPVVIHKVTIHEHEAGTTSP
jgi:cyclophilin family peptidyl-prolyl cis-trans isomerase